MLDERIRNKVHSILENELWKELHKMRESNSCGTFLINNTNFVECMKKLLYPTRDEMLERDVKIKEMRKPSKLSGKSMNMDFDADFYFCVWGAGGVGKADKDMIYQCMLGIKVLNENKRKQIEDFFFTYKEKYVQDMSPKNNAIE